MIRGLPFLLLLCFPVQNMFAQLQANFTMDKQSGCSPLDIKFTNTTLGATSNVVYSWDFGNGNTSELSDPGATYSAEQSYTVTLTATDGGIKSTISKTVTVYKKPVVGFNVNQTAGCVPVTIKFVSSSTPGDGAITNYLWDYGDGKTTSGKDLVAVSNTYTVAQQPPVSLTVTNSFGCFAALSQPSLLTIYNQLQASFTASSTQLCDISTPVTFTNTSTGDGSITYDWSFGDGTKSTEVSPTHVFVKKGTYTVNLTVRNNAGCVALAKSVVVNAGNFQVNYAVPAVLCANQSVYISNLSTRPYDSIAWKIDGLAPPADAFGNLNYKFPVAGAYKVSLTAYYKNCAPTIVKTVNIGAQPVLKGFEVSNSGSCAMPISFTFTDSTKDAVKWQWLNRNNTLFGNQVSANRSYPDSGSDKINLVVTNQFGCISSISKIVSYYDPKPAIFIRQSSSPAQSPNRGCPGLRVVFSTTPANEITKFLWDFGDGSATSTQPTPTKNYNKAGSYRVQLTYETKFGCQGTISYDSIFVNSPVRSGFSVLPDTLVCGNSPVTFTPDTALPNRDYIWVINGVIANYGLTADPFVHRFDSAGYYTISLVMRSGTCSDTVTRKNYVHVLPPFPKIARALNTCAGTRGLVAFTDSTIGTNSWHWDFGDGLTRDYSNFVKTLSHTYTASGMYTVALTAVNGPCTVTDSLKVPVLLKQKPLLAADVTTVCTSDTARLSASGFNANPAADSTGGYLVKTLQFGDLSTSQATLTIGPWTTSFLAPVTGLETDKRNLRLITTSNFFNCDDTTNFIPLKTSGPLAKFKFTDLKCLKQPIQLTDASTSSSSSPIVQWQWIMGNGDTLTAANRNPVSYRYQTTGPFFVQLRITDQSGCTYTSPADSLHMVNPGGPLASFTASDTNILVSTQVNFTNTSRYMDNVDYVWRFPNNISLNDENPSYLFDQEGNFTISLFTKNSITGCTDTARQLIIVKKVQSIFTYEITYSGQNNCPPVLANFTSNSQNAVRILWKFGDGGTAENEATVSHVYSSAGLFTVTLYSFDAFGRSDSSKQVVEVKGPFAVLRADTSIGCQQLPVTLVADTLNAAQFRWDFGDGTIVSGTSKSARHTYTRPGVYSPAVILTDINGCTATSELGKKIILDSLSLNVAVSPDSVICDSALVRFSGTANSFSKTNLGSAISFAWNSELHPGQNFSTNNALWYFNQFGQHKVSATVTTPYGCNLQKTWLVHVNKAVNAAISGPGIICIYDSVAFRGNSIPFNNQLEWSWLLGNGSSSVLQNPQAVKYNTPGNKHVTLVVSNGTCQDTAHFTLEVRDRPAANISIAKNPVCLGDTATFTVGGIYTVNWQPAITTSNNGRNGWVVPTTDASYTATLRDDAGCINTGQVDVKVVLPFTLVTDKNQFTCLGTPITLQASGAALYQWWNSSEQLATQESFSYNPVKNETLRVKGSDEFGCFTDSADVNIRVGQLPSVLLGPDKKLVAGESFTMQPQTSSDVLSWQWQPKQYLQCTDCATPVCTPLNDISYTLKVTNADGCTATDTMRVEMLCGKDLVWVPTGFTPNNDNLNDRFVINGSGILIRHLVIFDRWGKKVFERSNLSAGDYNNSWDGTLNGQPLPASAYVYMLDVKCNSGETFMFKGSITLVR